jgi:predicted nucleic acid-binding protein
MTRSGVYADATVLIGLGRIDRLDLLAMHPTPIKVTTLVWAEVTRDPERPGTSALRRALEEGILRVVDEGDAEAYPRLDPGESTVLSAAATAHAAVLIDEREARTLLATTPSLHASIPWSSGVVGLLLLAKRQGRIARIKPLLDQLMDETFRIAPALYREALRLAGES